jgi:hypothetical protein
LDLRVNTLSEPSSDLAVGGSTIEALQRVRGEGLTVAGVLSVLDRLAGGADAIRAALGDGQGEYEAQHDRRGLPRAAGPVSRACQSTITPALDPRHP